MASFKQKNSTSINLAKKFPLTLSNLHITFQCTFSIQHFVSQATMFFITSVLLIYELKKLAAVIPQLVLFFKLNMPHEFRYY